MEESSPFPRNAPYWIYGSLHLSQGMQKNALYWIWKSAKENTLLDIWKSPKHNGEQDLSSYLYPVLFDIELV